LRAQAPRITRTVADSRGQWVEFDRPEVLASGENVKAVYLTPTVHNPLGTVMHPARRHALANVIRRRSLWLIEDAAYRFLEPDAPVPISWLVPERSFYIYSFTKPVALGLKVSYLAVPGSVSDGIEDFITRGQ
jgi:DNA-binding transcriptional MocR family regulator